MKAYDKYGDVIGESDVVEILQNQFRTVRFNYEDLRIASEPDSGRKQVRIRMFSIIDRAPVAPVLTSFEAVDKSTGRTALAGHQCLQRRLRYAYAD
ncbi:MAG TPA: hypothetical protein VGV87_25975 [Blastocatellia bacterium]|nr:hypothetical protein [Blastocatellia bacterium]